MISEQNKKTPSFRRDKSWKLKSCANQLFTRVPVVHCQLWASGRFRLDSPRTHGVRVLYVFRNITWIEGASYDKHQIHVLVLLRLSVRVMGQRKRGIERSTTQKHRSTLRGKISEPATWIAH